MAPSSSLHGSCTYMMYVHEVSGLCATHCSLRGLMWHCVDLMSTCSFSKFYSWLTGILPPHPVQNSREMGRLAQALTTGCPVGPLCRLSLSSSYSVPHPPEGVPVPQASRLSSEGQPRASKWIIFVNFSGL